ncbi:MAG TPA: hypothetical protein PKN48_06115 [Bacteroidales bacterium]|nr:hypothetical protein [Bacteroidales bacterium]
MKKRFFIILTIILGVFYFLAKVEVINNFFIFIGFNSMFFLDNYFCMTTAINPLILWGGVFLVIGSIWGVFLAAKKFKLKPLYKIFSILVIVIIIGLVGFIANPVIYGSSADHTEDLLWKDALSKNTYSEYCIFIRDFPNSTHKAEALSGMDDALWKTADQYKTYENYSRYLKEFPKGNHSTSAREGISSFEKERWSKIRRSIRISDFRRYLNEFPDGRHAKQAKRKIKKLR